MYICDKCGKESNHNGHLTKHKIWCYAKNDFLLKNNLNKKKIQEEYDNLGSIQEFIKKYPGLKVDRYYKLFKDLEINYSMSKSMNNNNTQKKRKQTCIKKFGEEHNFCKNSKSRKKWEKELLEKEGITNVFQRPEVIEKCINSMIEKYGSKSIAGKKLQKGKAVSSLNKLIYNLLDSNNIIYNSEFVLKDCINNQKYYIYDIKINNKIIEINGDYWHGNPSIYKQNDIIMKGSSCEILVKDKWEKDKLKVDNAINSGYQVLTIWEYDLINNTEETFKKIINYATS
jgi:hypothetical protein